MLVSGLSKTPNPKELANLFKEGVVAEHNHKAFITNNHVDAPEGFERITLPFLDPSQAERRVDGLPSVFIAPVGYKVPSGYKGHPLPYDPSNLERLTTKEVNLVHSTEETPSPNDIGDVRNPFLTRNPILSEPEQEVQSVVVEDPTPVAPIRPVIELQQEDKDDDVSSPTALVLNKIKLARNRSRAHLASLYRNQENKGPSGAVAPITSIVRDFNGRKRKRVLTKVVRKPYNPETTTTPATQKVSEEDVRTVVRIVSATTTTQDTKKDEIHEEVTENVSTVTTAPVEDEQITSKTTEEELEVATTPEPYYTTTEHFEPTFTTQYEAEPSNEPILFVTSPKPTPQPINFITRRTKPKISSTTEVTNPTTTEPPATTITFATPSFLSNTKEVTQTTATKGYQPTPFSPLDPFKRLRFKTTRKPFRPLETVATDSGFPGLDLAQTSPTSLNKKPIKYSSPLLKLRKYGFNQGDKNGRIYGQRIKARQRPSYWANREETYEYYPPTTESTTSTTKKPEGKKDEIKQKFRPFFDHIYEQLIGSTTTESPVSPTESKKVLPYWARPRSTTTANPFTINAEIYEVHPESKYKDSSSPSYVHADDEYYDEYYDNEHHAQPKLDKVEDIEYIEVESTTEHETADKHSTTEHHYVGHTVLPTDFHELEAQNYVEPESNFVDSDIHLDYGESQQHTGTTWNEVAVATPPRGLDAYSKEFTPSHQLANHHDKNYKQPSHSGGFNEHSQQQKLTVQEESDFIPFKEYNTKKPSLTYVEIDREIINEAAPIQITIDEVPVGDNDFIQNVLEEVYSKIPTPSAPESSNEVIDIENLVEDTFEFENEVSEDTTPFFFITPTTHKSIEIETETANVPHSTIVENIEEVDEEEDILSTIQTELETTQTPIVPEVEVETTTFEEPEPTAEFGQESIDDNLVDDNYETLFTTTPYSEQVTEDSFEVTTFRPNGGFLNSLSNFINKFLPAQTTTETEPPTTILPTTFTTTTTTTTTTSTTTTTQTTTKSTEKLLEVDVGIVDAEVTKPVPSPTPAEELVTLEEFTPTKPDFESVVTDTTTVLETTEVPTEEYDVTTIRFPLRLHRPKTYPPTAKDDYYHLESVKTRVTSDEVTPTTTELPTTRLPEELETEDERNVSKDVFGAIRREEYFKNWVARKYKKPEDGKSKFTIGSEFPTTSRSTTTTPPPTSGSSTTEVETEAAVTLENNILLPFAPTVLPRLDDYARRQKKISFLEKLKNSARNSLFKKDPETQNTDFSIPIRIKPKPTTTTTTTTTKKPVLYPRGSSVNLFKKWAGGSLSQAEFEKTILGVSTATEVTVQSRICVRGHCYNADDQAAASSFYKNIFR